ncbi:MAG: sigma-54-dependent Fis family transcriptional regulator [SAR324 cluster bacterium]|nr:sigma-54-dependent Fis family transcriptional regulator [SAR324 cluster bacterium]
MKNILISTRNQDIAHSISQILDTDSNVDQCPETEQAIEQLKQKVYSILFLDLEKVEAIGKRKESIEAFRAVLSRFTESQPTLEIVVMTARDRVRQAVMAVKAGANDFLTYPIIEEEVRLLVSDIYDDRILHSELAHFRDQFWAVDAAEDLNTRSSCMQKVFEQIKSVAPTRSTVLLTGETGTGKTRLAKLIHRHSSRQKGPIISINCGAIPDTLIESELFGHEKGAFTGAIRLKLGKFEIARGGTLFLDEIGTITPASQVKLLTVIQDGEFQRVGGENTIDTDIRLIAATNTDLSKQVAEGTFRKDLYYRLNVFPINIPMLQERKEDIPALVDNLINKFNQLHGKTINGIQPSMLTALEAYDWPGNIRELENLLERAHILETTDILTPESFPQEIFIEGGPTATFPIAFPVTLAEIRRQAADDAERSYLKELLNRTRGKILTSAEEAGISTRQLNKLLHKHMIRKEEYKNK